MFCQGHLLWMHGKAGRLSSRVCLVPEESTGKIPRWWPWWRGTWSVSCRCWPELIARVSLLFGRKWRWSVWASKATMIEFWAPRDRRRLLPWRQMAWQLSLLACPLISWTLCFCQFGIILESAPAVCSFSTIVHHQSAILQLGSKRKAFLSEGLLPIVDDSSSNKEADQAFLFRCGIRNICTSICIGTCISCTCREDLTFWTCSIHSLLYNLLPPLSTFHFFTFLLITSTLYQVLVLLTANGLELSCLYFPGGSG